MAIRRKKNKAGCSKTAGLWEVIEDVAGMPSNETFGAKGGTSLSLDRPSRGEAGEQC